MPLYFDFGLLIFIAPALILSLAAQMWVKSAYARGRQAQAKMSGYAAARRMLDAAGLRDVGIEETPGHLSDHYDPREKVLRLSSEVYHNHTLSSVGIAAHEAGHALQDARGYLPLVVRNFAVPAASFGSSVGILLLILGLIFSKWLMLVGIVLFSAVVFFQVVNLPVEFNASRRAKAQLVELGIVDPYEMGPVKSVLSAAA
ncbi:MAG: zinc metallopeptidase, partial [Planctomycetes bacterium]|nr:zinc metallopeptidase [Planctomycetota bacterium]